MPQFALIDYLLFFLAGCSRENKPKITYYDLFKILREKGPLKPTNVESRQILLHKILEMYNKQLCDDAYIEKIKSKLLSFTVMLEKKWTENKRMYDRFIEKNREWIKKDFTLPPENENSCVSSLSNNVGRPIIKFSECAEITKKKKVKHLVRSYTSPELCYAASTKCQISGKKSVSKLLNESIKTPTRAKKIMKSYICFEDAKPIPYTTDEALAFLIENKLSKQQYINIRIESKTRNCDIYPPYDDIVNEKKRCYPSNIEIMESGCKIPMQDLLDHTTNRIMQIPNIRPIESHMYNLEMLYKWGCDGSSGQSQYRMNFNQSHSPSSTDYDLFMLSIVPLQLRFLTGDKINYVIWENPRPSSTRFCRPIKYLFKKETKESTKEEVEDIEMQISKLLSTNVTHNGINLNIQHKLIFSMVDGKV